MVNNIKERIFYFDEIRALAILFVILCHTTTLYKPYFYSLSVKAIPSYLNILGWVGVPLFFMISGALLLNRDYDLKEFLKRRFVRIFIPFIFWMIITLVIGYFVLGFSNNNLISIFFGKNKYTWFVWTMLGIYLAMPVINSFIKRYGSKGIRYFLGIWFIVILLEAFGHYPFHNLDLTYFSGYLGFVILGYYLANKEFKLSDKTIMILGILTYFIFLTLKWYFQGHDLFITDSSYLSFCVIFASSGIFLFFKAISNYSKNNINSKLCKTHEKIKTGVLGKIILSISICSYGMYFVNPILFNFIKILHINSIKMIPVIFISVALISWLIIAGLNKIPFLRKFIGT